MTRKLRISEAELIASHSRVAEKEAIANHFEESLKVTNQALEQEIVANERLKHLASPTLSAAHRDRVLEEVLHLRHLNRVKDIERQRESETLSKSARQVSPAKFLSPVGKSETQRLFKGDSIQEDAFSSIYDASLIRAKAKAMAAAAEEQMKIEEELYQLRLRS